MPIFSIWKTSLCAASGALAGGTVGFLFGLGQSASPGTTLTAAELLELALLLGVLGWIVVLVVVGLWLHYGAKAIALPALVNSLITAVVTVLLADKLAVPVIDTWLGILVGTLVGALLCRMSGCRQIAMGGKNHGMR